MEIQEIKREKNVLKILKVSCDRLIVDFSVDGRKGKSEYFLYPALETNDVELIAIQKATTEDSISKGLPLASVSEDYSFTKIEEATEILKNDKLSLDLFQIPDDNLMPNGLALEIAPKPKRGYEWWYSKLYSSLRYPTSARRDYREERVVVMLIITDDGKLENPTVINEVDADFKLYVERLLNRMIVRWEPGIQNGKPITSAVVLPLNFVIVP
ncbi:energy transducer TonB [Catalinimonas niigatensis]|uniref:energy transducer TonB n=1 Tax=Catalinimonas niigatensis TaxID=1397264 RepID=UPI00266596EC|nr:energy transducer TonB [Catalinimonas niigatensis]WPP51916.1 energy transducer TonB [Catalinimonas niigatensis]